MIKGKTERKNKNNKAYNKLLLLSENAKKLGVGKFKRKEAYSK